MRSLSFKLAFSVTLFLLCNTSCQAQAEYSWDNWKSYKTIIISETAGLNRINEPVEVNLSFADSTMRDPETEIRVLKILKDNKFEEIACQIYNINYHKKYGLISCTIAFQVSIKGHSKSFYRLIYNNQNAQFPDYKTDLTVSGSELELLISNKYITADLTRSEGPRKYPKSGQIRQLTLNKKNLILKRFDRRIHWAPNFIRTDIDTNQAIAQWDTPQFYKINSGPVLCEIIRQGHLSYFPEIRVTAVYRFFASQPYFTFYSCLEFEKDLQLNRLRNDEITTDSLFTHLAFKRSNGEFLTTAFENRYGILSTQPLEPDAPWLCFYTNTDAVALGTIRLQYDNTNMWGNPSPSTGDYTKISDGAHGGKYWNRIIIDGESTMIDAGSKYTEKNAYILFELDEDTYPEIQMEKMEKILKNPLILKILTNE